MPTNDLLPFGAGVGANVLDQTSFAALPGRTSGFTSGVANSAQMNKVWRQSAFGAAMIGQFAADGSGQNTVDDGNLSTFQANFTKALAFPAQNGAWISADDTGTANALAVTLAPVPLAYVKYMGLRVKVANANTGATTINVNGLGTKGVVHTDGATPQAGDLGAGAVVHLVYDGTNFQIVGLSRSAVLNAQRSQVTADRGSSTQVVPDSVSTRVTNYSAVNVRSQGGTTFSSGLMTVGSGDAGLWFASFHTRQLITSPSGFTNALHVNNSATPVMSDGANVPSGGATAHGAGGRLLVLSAGDTLEMRFLQTTGGSVTFNDLYDFTAVRLGAA